MFFVSYSLSSPLILISIICSQTSGLRFESLFLSSSLESPLFQHLIFFVFASFFTLIPSCLFFCPLSDPLPPSTPPLCILPAPCSCPALLFSFSSHSASYLYFALSLSLLHAPPSSPPSPTLVSITVGEIALLEYLLHA